MAGYSAVIDLRVNGLDGLDRLKDKVTTLNKLVKSIKPIPPLFGSTKQSAELQKAQQSLQDLVRAYAQGNTRVAKFSTNVAGLNHQLKQFRSIAANAKVGQEDFNNAVVAGERAVNKLVSAELKRLDVLRETYTRQGIGGLTAEDQGPSGMTASVLALGKVLPKNIAGMRAYASELDRVFNLVEAGSVDFRALQTEMARVNQQIAVMQGAGPIQGPALPPSMRGRATIPAQPIGGAVNIPGSPAALAAQARNAGQARKAQNQMQENLMLGAGFPLLFGGGPAQVAGGLAGSFVGTGFGGQILGSALAQQLSDALVRIRDIQRASDSLNMNALRDSAIAVNSELDVTVQRLIAAGRADEARAAVNREITLQTGLLPESTKAAEKATNALGTAWNELVGAVSGILTIIGEPFVNALAVITQGIAKALQLINFVVSNIQKIAPAAMPIVFLFREINKLLPQINEEQEAQLASLQLLTDQQHKELTNLTKVIQLEKNRQLGNTLAEKQINAALEAQNARQKIAEEFEKRRLDLRKQYAGVTTEAGQRELALAEGQLNAQEQQKIKLQEVSESLVRQGLLIEENTEKYNRAAEAVQHQITALERSHSVATSRLSLESALSELQGAQLQREYEQADTAEKRLHIAISMFEQQVAAAKIQYEQTKLDNKLLLEKTILEARLTEIKYEQYRAQKEISLAEAESRGASPEILERLNKAYDRGLQSQASAVEQAYAQIDATREIVDNQNKAAEAVLKTKILQAESQLAQKLVSEEIGLSENVAQKLATRMGDAHRATLNTREAGQQVVGVIETANQRTVLLAQSMSQVARQASAAAAAIARTAAQQARLNDLRSSNSGSSGGTVTRAAKGAYMSGGFQAFADGGMVNRPTLGLIGEGGESEYVVPASKAKGFSMRYLSGARGSAAIPTSGDGGSSSGPVNINIRTGPVMRQNGQNYVSVGDLEQALQTFADTMLKNNRTPGGRRYAGIG